MIIHDSFDALLMDTITTGEVSGGERIAGAVINITEKGGSEHADLILSASAADAPLTLCVEGAEQRDGEFTEQMRFVTLEGEAFRHRCRIPKFCPQFIRLCVAVGDTAPSEPAVVRLRVAV